MDKMIKYANMQEVKTVDEETRIIEFVASKEVADYDNDIVKLDGMDISKIKKNRSFLWSHMQSERPIGKILRVWKDGKELRGKAQLTSEEEYDFGYSIFKLIKGGYINNISISFLPDWKSIEYKENKEGDRTQIITKSTLLEISAVNIGCNTGTSIQVKFLEDGANKAWEDDIIDGKELNQIEESIKTLKELHELQIKEWEDEPEEIDYEVKIAELEAELEALKDESYLYTLFDEVKQETKDNIDEFYDELVEEEEKTYQEVIDTLSNDVR